MNRWHVSMLGLFVASALSLQSAEFIPPPEQDRNQTVAWHNPTTWWPIEQD